MSRFDLSQASQFESRDGGITKGGLVRNGFSEVDGAGERWANMRPSLATSAEGTFTGSGLGLFKVGTSLYHMSIPGTAGTATSGAVNFAIVRNLNITGPSSAVDVYTAALALYPDAGSVVATYIVTVTGEIEGMTWDSGGGFPGGCAFILINLGQIFGTGGTGGDGGATSMDGNNGTPGQDALNLNGKTVSINNGGGSIWGGGGGGGGGGGSAGEIGSGGGGGAGNGPGGTGLNNGTDGDTSTFGTGGAAGLGSGAGGDGGDFGAAGDDGEAGVVFPTPTNGGVGGAAGKAIELSGGTADFTSGSGSPNVKGAVS